MFWILLTTFATIEFMNTSQFIIPDNHAINIMSFRGHTILKGADEVNFTKNGSIACSFYWEGSGKNYKGIWTTRKSEVTAVGSYQIQGNTLMTKLIMN